MDLCTVVIPTYNREKYIKRAILSVVNQEYKNVQVIVVDDGSTDNTEDIVRRLCLTHKNIVYIKQSNNGVSAARNKGIEFAEGKYISFLDSDDYLKKDYITEQITAIKNSDSLLSFCGCEYLANNSGIKRNSYPARGLLIDYLRNKTGIQTAGFFLRRDYIKNHKILFHEGCSSSEDLEFFCKCIFYANRYAFVKKKLVVIDDGHEGRLSVYSQKKIEDTINGWNRIWLFLHSSNLSVQEKNEIKEIIFGYRIPAAIIYGLLHADLDDKEKNSLILKYITYLNGRDFSNGLRSIKLYFAWRKLRNVCM